MAQTTINGRDGTADFSLGGQSYATVMSQWEVESNIQQIDGSVFATEGVPVWDPGMEDLTFRMVSKGTKGVVQSAPFIPGPQGATVVATASTGCTIAATVNFTRALIRRRVNATCIFTGEGISTGLFVITWAT